MYTGDWPPSASAVGTLTGYQMSNRKNTILRSRRAMLSIFLIHFLFTCVRRCQQETVTMMLQWPARAFISYLFPFIIMKSLPLH